MIRLNVLDIAEGTGVDGPGLRTAIYLAGCQHHCPGCHNPQSWDMNGGSSMTIDDLIAIVKVNDFNVTLSGGDPLFHPEEVMELCRKIKIDTGKTIWCYTGFTWEEISANKSLSAVMRWIDVLVDGRFDISRRDTSLRFRGSSNQRIIDVNASMGKISPIELTEYYDNPRL